jgi:tetratricopeptide (TPR) repeat protein
MPISYAQREELECAECGAQFAADVWLIVDSAERPDLWARVRDATIHKLTCPNGHPIKLDAPLLLRDARQGRIFFSPAKSSSPREDEEIARELGQHLFNALSQNPAQENALQFEIMWRGLVPLAIGGMPFQTIQQLQSILRELERPAALSEIPGRVELAEQAIRLTARSSVPLYWARLHAQLGKYLIDNPRGERAANLERAMECFEKALTVYSREQDVEARIIVQFDLGAAYAQRIRGERAENLEQAIGIFETALREAAPSKYPALWAHIQHNLGAAYAERIRGSRAGNLERALHAFDAALTIHNRDEFPEDWASTWHNVGNTYVARIRGERAENLERAIEAYHSALQVWTRERFPKDWANTQNDLASAYLERIHGDRTENVERALEACQAALTVAAPDTQPALWASAQTNLGNIYSTRLRGNHAENLEAARTAFENALTIYTHEAYPMLWAQAQNNLGVLYMERERGARDENIEHAIECFQAALIVRTRAALPEEWAFTQNNLGNAYAERLRGERAENLERAIAAHKAALTVFTREAYPEYWAGAQNNLGSAYEDRVRGDSAENFARAIQSYRAALEIFQPNVFPNDARRSASSLARLEMARGNWENAYAALQTALAAAERLYDAAATEEGKWVEVKENARLYRRMVRVCFALEPPRVREAFLVSEEGRSRLFRAQLGTVAFPAPAHVPRDLAERERALLQGMRNYELVLCAPPDAMTRRRWVEAIATTRSKLNELWDKFAREYDAGAYVALRRAEKITLHEIRDCLMRNS